MMLILFCSLLASATLDIVHSHGYEYRASFDGWIKAHKTILTWSEANEYCQAEGAELASPMSREIRMEMELIIGENNHTAEYIIGVRLKFHPKIFATSSSIPIDEMPVSDLIDYLDWNIGQCLAMKQNRIRVVSCESPLPYICLRQNNGENVTSCGTFDKGYVYVENVNRCYKMYEEKKSWYQAFYTCVRDGGYLASYKYLDGQIHPNTMHNLKWHGNEDVFIGMFRDYSDFESINGDNCKVEMANYNENNRCLILKKSGGIKDFSCHDNRPYLCEMVPKIRFPYPIKIN